MAEDERADKKDFERIEKVGAEIRRQLSEEGVDATVDTTRDDDHEIRIKIHNFEARVVGTGPWRVFLALLGGVAAASSLVGGYSKFTDALGTFFRSKESPLGFLITNAFAQASGGGGSSIQIVPIVVYFIYVIFSVGYVVSLIHVFRGSTPKDRANAMEILKTLTAFFIGAISSKAG